jgi:adenosylmethionine-8-amino-7-oxononanoate aminotransferase
MHGVADVTLEFIERLGRVAPGNLSFVKPFSGGSESIEAALKFTRQYFRQTGRPSKYKFISRYYGYHGATFGAMAASGTGKRKTPFEPQMAGFIKVFPPTYYRDRLPSWEECNRFAAQSVEDVIVHEDPDTVAAVLVEPIGNTGGIITPTDTGEAAGQGAVPKRAESRAMLIITILLAFIGLLVYRIRGVARQGPHRE